MATRATYQFDNANALRGCTTIYLHWDGYPEGAAQYALEAIEKNGGQFGPEQMIRAHDGAQITNRHESHGDTEYRYTFKMESDGWNVAAYKRVNLESDKWECCWAGMVTDFIRKHTGVEVRNLGNNGRSMFTLPMALAKLVKKIDEAAAYKLAHPTMIGNQGWNQTEINNWCEFAAAFKVMQEPEALAA